MEDTFHLALFHEDQLDQVAEAIAKLKKLGLRDKDMSVISGVPFSEKILGRPMAWTRVPYIALAGAGVGFLVALALNVGTVMQYPIRVGGMPYYPIPTSIVVTFELTMLGLLISTFLGVFIETISPSFGPKGYHPKITDGHIGILFDCPEKMDEKVHEALKALGAELIHRSEVPRS
ncbi:MAG: DUF3341 domain-containing protein [Anaerolineae bacterium]|nr:DUF3341 domain-containing protein [Anaerolineae bacterium]